MPLPSGPSFKIEFEPIGKRVDVSGGQTLLDTARQAGVGLATVCGGEGKCGRCRVVVLSGRVSPPVEADRRFLSQLELELGAGQRHACCCDIQSDIQVHVPKASLVTDQRLQLGGPTRPMSVDAAAPAVICSLSPLVRRTGWRITTCVRGRELVGVAVPGRKPMGLAVDLGTTKIAGYLVDLETGEELSAAGMMNPQIGYGDGAPKT